MDIESDVNMKDENDPEFCLDCDSEENFEDWSWLDCGCENLLVWILEEALLYDEIFILEESNIDRKDISEDVFIFRDFVDCDLDGDNMDMVSVTDSLLETDLSFERTLDDSILLEETFILEDICRSSSDVVEHDFIFRIFRVDDDIFWLQEILCSEESNWDLTDIIEEDFFLLNSRDSDDKYDFDVDIIDTTSNSEKGLENDFIFEFMLSEDIRESETSYDFMDEAASEVSVNSDEDSVGLDSWPDIDVDSIEVSDINTLIDAWADQDKSFDDANERDFEFIANDDNFIADPEILDFVEVCNDISVDDFSEHEDNLDSLDSWTLEKM